MYRPLVRRWASQADTSAMRQSIVRLRGITAFGRETSLYMAQGCHFPIDSITFIHEPRKCEQTVTRRESNGLSFFAGAQNDN